MMKQLPSNNKIGVGIVTYNRPKYLAKCLKGVEKNFVGVADSVWVYNDGSSESYMDVKIPEFVHYYQAKQNKGVASAKNWLFKQLMKEQCDWIFILEDDIVPQSPKAITGYIEAARESGLHHYNFAHHGQANADGPLKMAGKSDFYAHFVGAWSMYTRKSLKDVGLMDENFHNAWEHVEHTWRMAKKQYTTWPLAIDAIGSAEWLKEIPNSIRNSSIRKRADWRTNVWDGLDYWKAKDKEYFPLEVPEEQ